MNPNEKKSVTSHKKKVALKRNDNKSNEVIICKRTLKNLGMTYYVNASLQVIASIPEAVTCIMNLRFEAGIHILYDTNSRNDNCHFLCCS